MQKICFLTVVLLILVGWGATAQPTVSNINLTPELDITHFKNYTLSADVTPGSGNTVTGVSFVVRPQTASATNSNWDFLTNGTPNPNPNVSLKETATYTSGNAWSFTGLRPDNIYSEIAFIYNITSAPSNSRFWKNSYQLMRFTNNYVVTEKTSFFIEVNATPNSGSPPSADMQVYLVGKGFDINAFRSGVLATEAWQTHASVELVGTINRTQVFHHTHSTNSSHHLVPLSTDANGKIGNKKLDINGDFWIILTTGHQLESRGWDMKFHTTDGCNNNGTWYQGSGTIFTAKTGCPDVHVHFAREASTPAHNNMEVKVEVNYTSNDVPYTYLSSPQTFSFAVLPNLAPNASAFTAPAPGTYKGDVTISWLPATDPNNDAVTYNLSLITGTPAVKTPVATVLTGTSYVLNTTLFPNADYDILVEACDADTCTGFNWSSNIDESGYFRILNGGIFWTGNTSNVWSTASNWSPSEPLTISTVVIPRVLTSYPEISSTVTADILNIDPGAMVTVTETGALDVADLRSDSLGLVIESGTGGTGSLIHSSNIAGATIQRYFSDNRWYVVGVPVINQAYNGTYFSDNMIPGNTPTSPSFYGITNYNETLNEWNSYFTSAAGSFVNGTGYLMRRSTGGIVTFSGIMASGNQDITVALKRSSTPGVSNGWNAIGNPYSSAISTTAFLNTANIGSLEPSFAALYIWDEAASTTTYQIVNQAPFTGYENLQSGQGFIVRAKEGGSTVTFSPSMRVHQTALALKSGQASWPGVVLAADKGGVVSSTSIAFQEGMTNGLDVGYDAGVFKSNTAISVHTRLVNCNGIDFGLQCLPLTALDRSTIPVGLEVSQSGEVKFTLKKVSLEADQTVTLEDRTTSVFRTFSGSEDHYIAQVVAGEPAYGRFYLHFGSVTSTDDPFSAKFAAYYQQGEVKVNGMMQGGTTIMLHDMQGRLLVQQQPAASVPQNRLESGVLPNGIYLLTIIAGNQRTTLKIPVGSRQ